MCSKYSFTIKNDFTDEVYERLKIKDDLKNKDEYREKFNNKTIICNPKCKKYIKGFRKDIPIFTDKLENAMIFNSLDYSYPIIADIFKNKDNIKISNYLNKILGPSFEKKEIFSCKIEFRGTV